MRMTRFIEFMVVTMIFLSIIMGSIFLSHAYHKGWIFSNFESIGAKKVASLMHKENNVTILDVRSSREYNRRHLKNAINIPIDILKNKVSELQNEKQKLIIVYCKSGNRSVRASRILANNGYLPLNVQGGMRQLIRNHVELVY